jgi:hypothetical protein
VSSHLTGRRGGKGRHRRVRAPVSAQTWRPAAPRCRQGVDFALPAGAPPPSGWEAVEWRIAGKDRTMHRLELTLEVESEPKKLHASKEFQTNAEVIELVSEFLTQFATPDRGPQQITMTLTSS